MRRLIVFLALCCTAGAPLSAARAEVVPGAVTLTPFAGSYVFDQRENLEKKPVYGLGLSYSFTEHWAAEGVLSLIRTRPEQVDLDIEVVSTRLDLLYHFTPAAPATFYFAAGIGGLVFNPEVGDSDRDLMADYGLGLKAFLSPGVALRFDVRHILTADNERFTGDKNQNFSFTGGLAFQSGGRQAPQAPQDQDNDGIIDPLDRCADTPAGLAVDADGCTHDNDGDGVADDLDLCAATPSGVAVDEHGCPLDSDGDGVSDDRDRCPGTPEGTVVDLNGCPEGLILDSDNDGVADDSDQCPGTPAGAPVDPLGCPLDSDGDGVADFADRCPDTLAGVAVTANGCEVVEAVAPLNLNIPFQPGKEMFGPQSDPLLAQAAEYIQAHPGAQMIIEGHTDSVGRMPANQRLSQKRAEAVRQYLIDKEGIAPERLEARGLGEIEPIADNATPEGRKLNRRVVIRIEP
jgi:OOP family OmpA-OmpF porin